MIKGHQFYLVKPKQLFLNLLPNSEIGDCLKVSELLNIEDSEYLLKKKLNIDFAKALFLLKVRRVISNSEKEGECLYELLLNKLIFQDFDIYFSIEAIGIDITSKEILENTSLNEINELCFSNGALKEYIDYVFNRNM